MGESKRMSLREARVEDAGSDYHTVGRGDSLTGLVGSSTVWVA